MSFMKFDVWLCDSLVHVPDSKSIIDRTKVVVSARTAILPASLTPSHTASVSEFSLQLIPTRNRPTLSGKFHKRF